jgi:DNA repair exonuclease SbcCD ATPase subunit
MMNALHKEAIAMFSEISERLTQVVEKKRRKEKIEQDLSQVKARLAEKSKVLASLEHQLRHERVDVERLEGLSLTSLFYSVLGSREQQVEKERQELLAAQLKYQQAKRAVEDLQADLSSLEAQWDELRGLEEEYSSLLARKEDLMRQSRPEIAAELVRLSEQIADRQAEKREIDEAIAAAKGVHTGLERVIASLDSAEGWGTWDLLGGGLLSTAMKHSEIDDARAAVADVQSRMSRFTRELADVQRSMELHIDISQLDVFADYFFDGLITDWIVQSKIQASLEQAQRAQARMAGAIHDLQRLQNRVQTDLQSLKQQRIAVVERA